MAQYVRAGELFESKRCWRDFTLGHRFGLRQPAHRHCEAGNKASRTLWDGPVTAWEADKMPTSASRKNWHTQQMDGMHDQLQGGLKASTVIAGKPRATDRQMQGIECIVAGLW
jgi:hypothetical protein